MTEGTAEARTAAADAGAAAGFERLYRANVEAVTAYFARRSADPHVVADLTADTFVAVITGFGSFDPRKGTARAWVFGIARRVYASYCQAYRQQQHKAQRLAGRRDLDPDQVEELAGYPAEGSSNATAYRCLAPLCWVWLASCGDCQTLRHTMPACRARQVSSSVPARCSRRHRSGSPEAPVAVVQPSSGR